MSHTPTANSAAPRTSWIGRSWRLTARASCARAARLPQAAQQEERQAEADAEADEERQPPERIGDREAEGEDADQERAAARHGDRREEQAVQKSPAVGPWPPSASDDGCGSRAKGLMPASSSTPSVISSPSAIGNTMRLKSPSGAARAAIAAPMATMPTTTPAHTNRAVSLEHPPRPSGGPPRQARRSGRNRR